MSAELYRLLENILRVGVVAEVDTKNWMVRVRSGDLLTGWLRWNTVRAGTFKLWLPPAVGEQVIIGCMGGNPETAMIIGSLYSVDNPAPGQTGQEAVLTAPDGATFRYDAATGALEATGIKTADIYASVGITLHTPKVTCTQHLETATLSVTQGGEMQGNFTHSSGKFTSNGVQVDSHDHGGVQHGGSWTEGIK
ncbi:phage baseplate assembly protein V [Edwardsiella tarda]|uniref:phage baseplate assembly protein V n=1 Tax=Edwardsiella tarda TaxID=636 RepID=UPI00351CA76E